MSKELIGTLQAFKPNGDDGVLSHSILIEQTDKGEDGMVELAFDVDYTIQKGRAYIQFNLPALMSLVFKPE